MKKFILSTLVLALSLSMAAQQPQPLPIDSAVRVGKLENGLTYYIRHNEYPKQRAEFHIAQAVGAILEEDHQNGLAHFLEHMAFNGTEHFAGKGIIERHVLQEVSQTGLVVFFEDSTWRSMVPSTSQAKVSLSTSSLSV